MDKKKKNSIIINTIGNQSYITPVNYTAPNNRNIIPVQPQQPIS